MNSKKSLATIGLVFITLLASLQYIFLGNVPDTVSTFSFVCVTNVIGLVLLFVFRSKRILSAGKTTVKKGAFFALLLTGFNFFLLLGSNHMESIVVSSVVSLYFVFVTPMLLLLRRHVNFFSSIATAMASIALLLMFGGNAEALFSSSNVIYLVIGDICFAAYVVSVSVLGEGEDSAALAFFQMCFASLFSLAGWAVEAMSGKAAFSLPSDTRFWISAVFIGVFIRAVYGLLQITCQKHVSAMSASLIFSTEIIMTMLMEPIMTRLLGTRYVPPTLFQIIGAFLLIIATLLVDETVTTKLGYANMEDHSISKKIVVNTITFSLITLLLSTIVSFSSIYLIRDSAVEGSSTLGREASEISASAMIAELEYNTTRQARDKAKLAEDKLGAYADAISLAADYATALYARAGEYPARRVDFAEAENAGKWTMQLLLADREVGYDAVLSEIDLLGNMEEIFAPIAGHQDNVLTIYLGTEDGVMISYDRDSQLAAGEENRYYEYRESGWYGLGREQGSCTFSETYWDSYGRGLTITCVAPFFSRNGTFQGCVAMDVLMRDLNASMVSDGIVEPTVATMIDENGNVIASGDLDPDAEQTFNIFDEESESYLKPVGREIIENKDGILRTGEGESAVYVTYATIESTGWKLCIRSPVSAVVEPAYAIKDSIDANTEAVVSSVLHGVLTVIQSGLVLVALILIIVTMSTGRISDRISKPIRQLEHDVQSISGGNLDNRTSVDTDDEIGSLARSFNRMTDSLQQYVHDLKEVTAREERIASELAVATNIQESMLPRNFDEFNRAHKAFELFASMTPAKEVGGDFYDFFFVDDDHLALVMADVSGKGVPAALFMVRAMTLIKNRALSGGTPAEVLSDANDQLCEGNEGELFVTVWMAIIELSTGKGIAANAGHEHPALRRANGDFELVKYRHSPAVATMEGMRFKEHDFALYPGDTLFVYTDGVPEATNAENELFGEERLLAALNEKKDAMPKEVLELVRNGVDRFVKEAEQFDDLTMLGLRFHGTRE